MSDFEGPKKRQENGAFSRKDISGNVGSSISGVGTRKKQGKARKRKWVSGLLPYWGLLVGGGPLCAAHMAIKGLTFTLSQNLQLPLMAMIISV